MSELLKRLMLFVLLVVAAQPMIAQENDVASRKYTAREVDELRSVCETKWLYGTTYWEYPTDTASIDSDGIFFANTRMSRAYREEEKVKAVEELVRTYMLAGITAKDIIEEDRRKALGK